MDVRIKRLSESLRVSTDVIRKCIDKTSFSLDIDEDKIIECVLTFVNGPVTFEELPEDVHNEILKHFPVKDFIRWCSLTKSRYLRCGTSNFWINFLKGRSDEDHLMVLMYISKKRDRTLFSAVNKIVRKKYGVRSGRGIDHVRQNRNQANTLDKVMLSIADTYDVKEDPSNLLDYMRWALNEMYPDRENTMKKEFPSRITRTLSNEELICLYFNLSILGRFMRLNENLVEKIDIEPYIDQAVDCIIYDNIDMKERNQSKITVGILAFAMGYYHSFKNENPENILEYVNKIGEKYLDKYYSVFGDHERDFIHFLRRIAGQNNNKNLLTAMKITTARLETGTSGSELDLKVVRINEIKILQRKI